MEIKEKIGMLIVLQQKDVQLDALRLKAGAIPKKIEEEKSLLENIRVETEDKKKNLTTLQLDKKAKELDLEAKEGQIRKHSSELNSIKSNDTYRSLLQEIDNCKKDKMTLENQILDVMEAIEKESQLIKANDKVFKEKEAEFTARLAVLQDELKKIETEISGWEADRAEYIKQIPLDIVSKYDYIRESRDGFAVVPVEGENCGGCQIVLRPQIINDVFKCQDIVLCDSCSRILYKK